MPLEGTRLETDEEIRQALAKYRQPAAADDMAHRLPTAPADDGPPPFHPTERPPTPLLVILDDGSEEGEPVRIRQDRLVIGRTEGDLRIPHDAQISARHAELRCTLSKDKHRWYLVDLKSTNGSFVRVGHALLEHDQEFLIGHTRLRFENPRNPMPVAASSHAADQSTRPWKSGGHAGSPAVVTVEANGHGARKLLSQQELWIGKDPNYCQLILGNDPFVSARHARIRQDEHGRWMVENNKSLNGVWLRVQRLALTGNCRFLLGEQQFMFRCPS